MKGSSWCSTSTVLGTIALLGSLVVWDGMTNPAQSNVLAIDASQEPGYGPQYWAQAERPSFELEDFDFWAEQCLLMGEERQYEDALAACEEALTLKPRRDNVEIWATRSEALFHLGHYAEAVVSLNRVIGESPNYSLAIARQCASHFHLDRYQEAVDFCEQALRIDGNWGTDSPAFAWYYRGLALRQLGRLETALSSFDRAISLEPDDPLSIAERCSVLADLGNYAALATCTITDPEELAALGRSITSNNLGDGLRRAIALYEQALAIRPDDTTLWIQQGLALEQLGDYERALRSYDSALTINATSSLASTHRCRVLNALGDYETALAACEQALLGDERWGSLHSAYAWSQQSASLLGLEQYDDALAAAQRAVDREPGYGLGWNNQAVSLWRLQRHGEALAAIDAALAQYDEAVLEGENTFERSYPEPLLLLYREQIIANYNRGRILSSLGRYETAVAAYTIALDQTLEVQAQGVLLLPSTTLSDIYVNQSVAYLLWSEVLARDPSASTEEDTNSALAKGYGVSQEAVRLNPASQAGWYNQGLIALRQRLFGEAFQAFAYASYLQPEDVSALIGQGIALTGQGNTEEAIARFDLALNLNPTSTLAEHCRTYVIENYIFSEIDTPTYSPNQCNRFF